MMSVEIFMGVRALCVVCSLSSCVSKLNQQLAGCETKGRSDSPLFFNGLVDNFLSLQTWP